ncbi:hypothetical protein OC834_007869, partial [Tilletia horrida]
MAPKKRKDIGDPADLPASGSTTNAAAAEGQAQPPSSFHSTPTPEPEAQHPQASQQVHQEREDSMVSAIHDGDKSDQQDNRTGTPRVAHHEVDSDLEDMSVEELEAELRLQLIRLTLLKKQRKNIAAAAPPATPKRDPPPMSALRFSVPPQPAHQGFLPEGYTGAETESVLRERQNERLRRAGLLPSRASETLHTRVSPQAPTMRPQSVVPTTILYGIDKKIADIMNTTLARANVVPGDKSALSRAGIKMAPPDKWSGEQSLQKFTDFVHSVAHYFKIHAPLSESLKVDLIGGYLSGDPLDWYWRYVAPNEGHWTAADVMVGIRRQFLVDELSRKAADDFDSAKQGSQDVHAFQTLLLKLADQMAEYPSPVALNRRLLKGLKHSISSAIVANRGIDAEMSSWEDIVHAAMDQERAFRYANTLKDTPLSTKIENTAPDVRKKDEPARMPNVSPATRVKAFNPSPGGLTSAPRSPHGSQVRNTAAPQPSGIRPTGPKPTDQCRRCGAFGHWSSDCPERLATNRVSLSDDSEQPEDDELSGVNVFVLGDDHGDACDEMTYGDDIAFFGELGE